MKTRYDLRPFVSVLLVIFTLLSIVFSKMEVRRMGYSLLKESRQLKSLTEQKRLKEMTYAQLTRPERIETFAERRLSLKKAQKGQIVQISGERIALTN